MLRPLRNVRNRLGGYELLVLVALLAIIVGAWAFIEVADAVTEGQTQGFDDWLVRAMRQPNDPATPIGPTWLAEVGRDLTAMGGVAMLSLVTLAVAGFLLISGKLRIMLVIVGATAGGLIISGALKALFDRPRPSVVPHLSLVYTSSFPSGHSMMAAVVYLTLGTLLAELVVSKRQKLYFLSVALLLTGLVGVSRVYMGVHYPTDVLAGWSAGLTWAVVCWLIARALRRRGAVEPHSDSN